MLVSTKWLKEYVNTNDLSAEVLADKITRSGIEVDGIETLASDVSGLIVGEVVHCEKHPEADKLNICQVNIGDSTNQIVCGAPNVAAGQKVIVAVPGAILPGGMKIEKATLRGEESHGMICSLQEIGVDSKLVSKAYTDGIYVLPSDAKPGADVKEVLGLDDTILELGLTPNRADAMSMLGVAYEVGAILQEDVRYPEITYTESETSAESALELQVEAMDANPLYIAKVIKNVTIADSPIWLQQRLMAAGVRPHNNVVDVTNYVLMELGQPLHAFDYDRLKTNKIVVRKAKEGESIVTLDKQTRPLGPHQLVITNGVEPVAVAGVMGGANSEVHAGTTTIVLESAYFAPSSVRQTSKDHNLRSDASSRFEKGVDPNRVALAAERAAKLIADIAGGEVLSGSVVFDQLDKSEKEVVVSTSYINKRLGMNISASEMSAILTRLQFEHTLEDELLTIKAPTRRQDIQIQEDIMEEIARIYGYDQIPLTLPVGESLPGGLSAYQTKRRLVRNYLEGAGMFEAITYSLTSEALVHKYALEKAKTTKLLMPMSEERSVLRQSLVAHLLEVASYNVARQNDSVALFETSSVFLGNETSDQPYEEEHVAIVATGKWVDHQWQGEQKQVDFYVLKGIVEGLMVKLGLSTYVTYEKGTMDGLHPGRTAIVKLAEITVGYIAALHPKEQKSLDLKETYVAELNLEKLLLFPVKELVYKQVAKFPSITRDIALVVDQDVSAGKLQTIITKTGGELLKSVHVFDLYEGDKMEAGKKSLAFSLTYGNDTRTLTDEEVVAVHETVLEKLKEEANAELRG
ncbi:phenylalanine--tRNA ligase subunit beta [Paenisporosarcina cavernae]|uniref:Phenylalanine--tRNA ligase beta subunit n=1 Tax=Paenisporosarcina cavernae TaxID=2320858 RepID=A0A385YSI3_9BACL|nr:phenylalanine--tRNA ligase subunit beta [Paenisporosarcina cavernae]AYC29805.1 phenylalanine--tRNA ligase subunit beta [Paenisporosarcina cavernae]